MSLETEFDRLALLKATGRCVLVDGREVWALFERDHAGIEFQDGVQMGSSQPRITARTSDLADARRGSTVLVDEAEFTIYALQPDGTGMTVAPLKSA